MSVSMKRHSGVSSAIISSINLHQSHNAGALNCEARQGICHSVISLGMPGQSIYNDTRVKYATHSEHADDHPARCWDVMFDSCA